MYTYVYISITIGQPKRLDPTNEATPTAMKETLQSVDMPKAPFIARDAKHGSIGMRGRDLQRPLERPLSLYI